MDEILSAAIFGMIGGMARACIGLLKHSIPQRPGKFSAKTLATTVIGSGLIGLFMGLLVATDYKITLLAGYAGTDFIENMYKIRKGGFGFRKLLKRKGSKNKD